MLETILFDLDDTLLDFTGGERVAVRQTLAQFGVTPTDAVTQRYHEINAAQWRRLERREATRAEIQIRRFTELFSELGQPCDGAAVNDAYRDLLSRQHDYLPGAEALLEELCGRFRLYLVSNGTGRVQARRIRESGIGRFFRDVFISEELGADKPSPVFFDACFSRIPGFSRETAVLVGDSLTSDIQGGVNAGLRTIWYAPHGGTPTVRPDHIVASLDALPPLLEIL